jgi:hypothetical protein
MGIDGKRGRIGRETRWRVCGGRLGYRIKWRHFPCSGCALRYSPTSIKPLSYLRWENLMSDSFLPSLRAPSHQDRNEIKSDSSNSFEWKSTFVQSQTSTISLREDSYVPVHQISARSNAYTAPEQPTLTTSRARSGILRPSRVGSVSIYVRPYERVYDVCGE